MFLIWSKRFKSNFRNRKWNYSNRKLNYFLYFKASNQRVQNQFSKQEMELFLKLPSFWSKNFYFQIMNKLSEDWVNKQEDKLVMYNVQDIHECKWVQHRPDCIPLIKILLFQHHSHMIPGVWINFHNSKWNYPNRKWNYFSNLQASNQKLLLLNVSHLIQEVWI